MPTALDKVLYTAKTHAVGGREGTGRSDDGRIEVKLSSPGGAGQGTNPEQLFGVGYSACFLGAMKAVAPKVGVQVPNDTAIDAEVDLGPTSLGYGIAVRLNITVPGMERAKAEQLVAEAHKVCPYSNATRNNIDVQITVK
ncbi:organic hydroperoxide resistance protein [Ramlibacter sp. USB13]|uniref:Organic hydroperoxide resistance protein n=1 Tax=Ramlibacter cellulosilyticus TaxID=2764187 RepID=A0A923MTY7_9BURK|nr:organic hydroperoxide resistance protein [Ramlibacter cellulosilyticus]MBC5785130.1 organic hydroperoxide resistance protein [Ramlibacter cellulosilyticus]